MQPADTTSTIANNGLNTTLQQVLDQIGQMPNTVMYVAITVGLMLFVVGWFAGIKQNKTKMMFSALIVCIVGFFSLRVPAWLFKILVLYILPPIPALIVVYLAWLYFLLAMAIFLYETWIVTIKEQFGSGR
ncbi:MAG: hypothetical protein D6814_01615 [Calditrichaeota bacterium]|nr:MAG: hypothetical protein D6814_01615 [Calditrichota bacterium]